MFLDSDCSSDESKLDFPSPLASQYKFQKYLLQNFKFYNRQKSWNGTFVGWLVGVWFVCFVGKKSRRRCRRPRRERRSVGEKEMKNSEMTASRFRVPKKVFQRNCWSICNRNNSKSPNFNVFCSDFVKTQFRMTVWLLLSVGALALHSSFTLGLGLTCDTFGTSNHTKNIICYTKTMLFKCFCMRFGNF